jgi:branched-chain amino acid transport system substrate-binding protein
MPQYRPVVRPYLFLLAIAAIACSGDSSTVQIGAAGPWGEVHGQMNRRGIVLAVEEINARGGVRGRPLRVIERDDEGDGATAASIAGEFVANRAVVGVARFPRSPRRRARPT